MTIELDNKAQKHLALGLLSLRLSIGLVFLVWAFDKIIKPEHSLGVFSHFYGIDITTGFAMLLGFLQIVFVIIFMLGMFRHWTYMAILVLHAGSTFSSFAKYLDPFNNLLFFAAWPMLAACLMLYLMRDYDCYTVTSCPFKKKEDMN